MALRSAADFSGRSAADLSQPDHISADFSGKMNNDGFGRNEAGVARKGSRGVLGFCFMLPMLAGGENQAINYANAHLMLDFH